MALSNRIDRRFLIDKRLIAINFDAIALIECALFNPKPVNILALKRIIAVPLSKQELLQEWLHPNSFVKKIFLNILMSEISRCLFLEQDMVNQLVSAWKKEAELETFLDLLQEAVKAEATKNLTMKEKLESQNSLLIEALAKPMTIKQLIPVTDYLIESLKTATIQHYLGYAHSVEEAKIYERLITDRFERVSRNIQRLNNILSDSNTTEEQRERALEIQERYMARFTPERLEITQRIIDSRLDSTDQVMVKQSLYQQQTAEEIYEKAIQGIKMVEESYSKKEYSSFIEEINEKPSIRSMLKPAIYISQPKLSEKESKLSWQAHIFKSLLIKTVEELTKKDNLIIHEIKTLTHLQQQLNQTIKKPTEENRLQTKKIAETLIAALANNSEDHSLSEALRGGIKAISVDEEFEKQLEIIEQIAEDSQTSKNAKPQIQNLLVQIRNGVNDETVYEIYSNLAKEFADQSFTEQLRCSLLALNYSSDRLPKATTAGIDSPEF